MLARLDAAHGSDLALDMLVTRSILGCSRHRWGNVGCEIGQGNFDQLLV